MQRLAVRWGGVVQTTHPVVGRVRDSVIELLDRTGAAGWLSDRAKPRPRYSRGAFASGGGELFPQPDRLDEQLGRGWAVVASTAAAAAAWRDAGLHAVEHPHERYVNVRPRLAAKALRRRGASAFEVEHAVRMAAYFASGADGAPTDAVRRLTGRAPRTTQQFLNEKGS
jgi:hypothetical protein